MKKRITALLLALILSLNMTGSIFGADAISPTMGDLPSDEVTDDTESGDDNMSVTPPPSNDNETSGDTESGGLLLTIDFANGDNGLQLTGAQLEDDAARGQVLRLSGKGSGTTGSSYALLSSSVFGDNSWKNGMTLAMWIKTDAGSSTLKGSAPLFSLDIAGQGYFSVTSSLEHTCNSDGNDTSYGITPRLWADPANVSGAVNATAEGIWQHVALVYAPAGISLYVDGELYSNPTINGGTMDDLLFQLESVRALRLGSWACPWWNFGDYQGKIDDVMLYNTALTADDISALVEQTKSETNEPDAVPEEEVYIPDHVLAVEFTNHDGGMAHAGSSLVTDDERGTVLAISGQGTGTTGSSYALLETTVFEDNSWADGMTIAMWVKTNEGSSTLTGMAPFYSLDIVNQGYISVVSSAQFACNTTGNDSDTGITPCCWADPSNQDSCVPATQEGVWQHLVTVFHPEDGIKIYLDGKLLANPSVNGGTMADLLFQLEFVHALRLGSWACPWWNHGDYEGRIDDILVFNTALNGASVKALANYTIDDGAVPDDGGAGEIPDDEPTAEIVLLNEMEGAQLYGSASYSEFSGYTNAFDGNILSYYNAKNDDINMQLGINLDTPVQLTGLRIYPRARINRVDVGYTVSDVKTSSEHDDSAAANLFDGTADTRWKGDFNTSAYVEWTMPEAIAIKGYTLGNATNAADHPQRIPISWILYGFNETDQTWEIINEQINNTALVDNVHMTRVIHVPDNTASYRTYRFEIMDIYGITNDGLEQKNWFMLGGLKLYDDDKYSGHFPYYIYNNRKSLSSLQIEGSNNGIEWTVLGHPSYNELNADVMYQVIDQDSLYDTALNYTYSQFRVRYAYENHLEIAELEFYGIENSELEAYPSSDDFYYETGSVMLNQLPDTEFFGAACYSEGTEYNKAFDNDPATFYDARTDSPVAMNIGMTVAEPMELTGFSFIPRNNGLRVKVEPTDTNDSALFDYDPTTRWTTDTAAAHEVIWKMETPMVLTGYSLLNSNSAQSSLLYIPTGWTLYGSNDQEVWTVIDQKTNDTTLHGDEYRLFADYTETFEDFIKFPEGEGLVPYIVTLEQESEEYTYFKLVIDSVGYPDKNTTAHLASFDLIGSTYWEELNAFDCYTLFPQRLFDLVLEGSSDGEVWEVLYEFQNNRYYPTERHLFYSTDLKAAAQIYTYTQFRLRHTDTLHLEMAELDLYGRVNDTLPVHPGKIEWIKDETYVVIEEVVDEADMPDAFGENYPSSVNWDWSAPASGELLTGTIIAGLSNGQHSWGSNPYTCAAAVFDGDTSTFFDAVNASTESWAGIMFDSPCELTEVRVTPRENWIGRLAGFAVQGSNDGENWNTIVYLGNVNEAPAGYDYHCFTPEPNEEYIRIYSDYGIENPDFSEYWVGSGAYRIYRFVNLNNVLSNFSEIELYGIPVAWEENVDYVVIENVAPEAMENAFGENYPGSFDWDWPEPASGELLTGTIIAGLSEEEHCWDSNLDCTAAAAFDGDTSTFFDPVNSSEESWAGLILDAPFELTEVRVTPRENWIGRLAGFAVQGSNDGILWETIVYLNGVSEAPAGYDYHCFTPEPNEEYIRIYSDYGIENPDFSEYWVGSGAYRIYRCLNLNYEHGNISEVELYGKINCEHELTYVDAVEKTCTTDGNIAYWLCGLCGRNYRDEAGRNSIYDVTIPASHNPDGKWVSNATHHWQVCADCLNDDDSIIDVHVYDVNCTAKINCAVCDLLMSTPGRTTWEEGLDYVVMDKILTDDEKGDLYGENYPISSKEYGWPEVTSGELLKGTIIAGYNGVQHNWIHEDDTNPDNGNTAFDGNVHTCFDPFDAAPNSWVGVILEKPYELTEVRIMPREKWLERMVGGAVQGSNDGINWVTIVYLTNVYECPAGFEFHCFTPETNEEYTAKYNHINVEQPDMSTYWVNGGAYTYFRYVNLEGIHGNVGEIELYGVVSDGEHKHILTETDAKAATCTADGNRAHWHCESCGLNYADSTAETEISDVVLKAPGHKLALFAANPASCTATGCIEHYKCSACGTRFMDAAGTIAAVNTTLPATGHNWGEGWSITVKPTTEFAGEAARTCININCGLIETKEVQAVTVAVTNEATADANDAKNQVSVNVIGDASEAVVVIDNTSLRETLSTLGAGSDDSTDTNAASGNITIDVGSAVSGNETAVEIKQVTIPKDALTDVAAAAASNENATTGLEVKLTTGSVVFDAAALNAIAKANTESSNIELKIEKIAADKTASVAEAVSETMTTDAQKDTLEALEADEGVQLLDAVDLTAGAVHDLGSKATISIPYDASNVEDTDGLKITYIHKDGTVEEIDAEFIDGCLVFRVTHFSVFFIVWSEPVYTLSGTVISYGRESTAFGVELVLDTPANGDAASVNAIQPVTLKGNEAGFMFENLVKGTYTLTINKKNHFKETCTITIGRENVVKDFELTHIGDITGDNDLNHNDLRIMTEYFSGRPVKLPKNIIDLADVDGDSKFTRRDVMIMARLVDGWNYTLKQ